MSDLDRLRGRVEPGRPRLPESYGVPTSSEGMLSWSHVSERMSSPRNYWLSTTRPDGRPHAVPVWGVWLDEAFYFGTDRHSRKGRNLATNPGLVVHLESGDDVVILEGVAEEVADPSLLARIGDVYAAKYELSEGIPATAVVYTLRPRVAHAWLESNFVESATRWLFGRG